MQINSERREKNNPVFLYICEGGTKDIGAENELTEIKFRSMPVMFTF